MAEQYVESITMWREPVDVGIGPLLAEDSDVDSKYEFKAKIKLVQIKKSVQNAIHNGQEYFFVITDIEKLEKQGA